MSNPTIPADIIAADKVGVEKRTYYGVPVLNLDRDGLLAALNCSAKLADSQFNSMKTYFEMNRLFKEARNEA